MKFEKEIKQKILLNSNFILDYVKLCINHHEFSQEFKSTSNEVLRVFEELGLHAKKIRHTYNVKNQVQNLKCSFSIDIKNDIPILSSSYSNEQGELFFTIPSWGYTVNKLSNEQIVVKVPRYKNYQELKHVLKDSFEIHLAISRSILHEIEN